MQRVCSHSSSDDEGQSRTSPLVYRDSLAFTTAEHLTPSASWDSTFSTGKPHNDAGSHRAFNERRSFGASPSRRGWTGVLPTARRRKSAVGAGGSSDATERGFMKNGVVRQGLLSFDVGPAIRIGASDLCYAFSHDSARLLTYDNGYFR